jgi:hypothetical protein
MEDLQRELLLSMRKATIVLLLDRLDRRAIEAPLIWHKLARAAQACGLAETDDVADLRGLLGGSTFERKALIDLLEHQLSYLRLAQGDLGANSNASPREQLVADPAAYAGFLAGVAASHRGHAQYVATLDEIRDATTLIDLGGGFGTYALAWAASNPLRTATVVDLPELAPILPPPTRNAPQVSFAGMDLRNDPLILPQGEVYLLANVLHLFEDWEHLLGRIVDVLPLNAIVVVMEAAADGSEGALFDLQVHIRSGCVAGLIENRALRASAANNGLVAISAHKMRDLNLFRKTQIA